MQWSCSGSAQRMRQYRYWVEATWFQVVRGAVLGCGLLGLHNSWELTFWTRSTDPAMCDSIPHDKPLHSHSRCIGRVGWTMRMQG